MTLACDWDMGGNWATLSTDDAYIEVRDYFDEYRFCITFDSHDDYHLQYIGRTTYKYMKDAMEAAEKICREYKPKLERI